MSWARLLTRVFAIDITTCPQCGGSLTILVAIEAPAVIGPFSNLVASKYWSEDNLQIADPNDFAFLFNFIHGGQGSNNKNLVFYAWAVRDGDVAPVPAPSTMLLMGSGLIGLVGWRWWSTKTT